MPLTNTAPGSPAPAAGVLSRSILPPLPEGEGQGVRASGGEVIECDGLALAPGDVVSLAIGRRLEIVDIEPPTMPTPRQGTIRRARVRWLDGQPLHDVGGTRSRLSDSALSTQHSALSDYTFAGFSLKRFIITGGPKLAAARVNPALIRHLPGPNYFLWIGDQAHV